jgi:hypothetical protein
MGGAGLQLPYLGEMPPHPQTLTLILESAKTGRKTILKKAEQLEEDVICKEEEEEGEDLSLGGCKECWLGLWIVLFFFFGGWG